METINQLKLKKRLEMRDYQETIVSDIISKFGVNKPYVLGSCPSSGKTEMAIETMIRLMESGLVDRVLILAHSTNVLKKNFTDRISEYFYEKDYTVFLNAKRFNKKAKIQIMIPQNINYVEGEFDLIIVDEAHHNVLAEDGNYGRIIEMVKPKFQLLLTGTPSKFVLENNQAEDQNDLPYHINCVGMDMIGFEHFHNVNFDLIKSAYNFNDDAYTASDNLKDEIDFDFKQTEKTILNVIIGAVRNISKRYGYDIPKNIDAIIEGRKLIKEGKFGKTLIMCRNIKQANQISQVLSNIFEIKVEVSHSKNDGESIELKNFKEGRFDFLCVVNRAREGYDDKEVVNLIDISMTHNVDLIYQMFCRVVRKDDTNNNNKLYLKVTSIAEGMPEYTMQIMTAALMLGATENLANFNGRNFRGIVIPRVERPDPIDEPDEDPVVAGLIGGTDSNGNFTPRRRITDLMALDLIRIFADDRENLIEGNDRYAMTTLGESLDILEGVIDFYRDKEGYFKLCINEKIYSSKFYSQIYKELSDRDNVKYHSTPWRLFNQTEKEFFDEILPKINFFNDKEIYFKLCREENITGSSGNNGWPKFVKKLSERDNVKYHSSPWKLFNQTAKDFFDECFGVNYENKEGYFKLFIDENITSGFFWPKKYKDYSKRDGVRYHSNPWRLFNQTEKEFFDECFNKNIIYDKETYFELFRKENITNNHFWRQRYKLLSERDGVKYILNVARIFKMTTKDFFHECFQKKNLIVDKEVYFKLCREENIKGSTGRNNWDEVYKKLSERDDVKYNYAPWKLFNQTSKEFFDECYPNRNNFCYDKEKYFKLFKENKIKISTNWLEKYKELSKRDNINYLSNPHKYFNQKEKELFAEYREWLKTNSKDIIKKPIFLGEFSELNKSWSISNSKTTHENIKKDPSDWLNYHKLYTKSRKNWAEIPYIEIGKKLKDRPEWVIGDFGCGENLLSKEIKNKVYAFDHYAIDENVISCDLSHVPLEDNKIDVAVFSLSLMGSNYVDYLKEAYRVLKPMGLLMICEPATKWEDKENELKEVLSDIGFKVNGDVKFSDRFIYLDGIKY